MVLIPRPLPLALEASPAGHGLEQAEILENGYVEPRETTRPDGRGETTVLGIVACPGLADLVTLDTPTGGIRAMHSTGNDMLAVAGRAIFRVDVSGAAALVGGIASDGYVSTAQNRRQPDNQIAIVCDGIMAVYVNGVLTEIADADLLPPSSVCHHDGYFVMSTADGRLQSTGIDDATSIEALDFATAESNSDGLRRVVSRGADLVAIGTKSTEFWQPIDSEVGFPFARATAIRSGSLSAGAIAEVSVLAGALAQTWIWPATDSLGKYAGVVALAGYGLTKISTPGVDRDIEDEADQAGMTATSWVQGGHAFYCLSGTSWSWQFDTGTRKWIKRTSHGSRRWRVSQVAPLGQTLFAGHHSSPILYTMPRTAQAEGTDPLIWRVQTPRFDAFPAGVEFNGLWLDIVPGVGLLSGDDADPQVMLQWTEDGENWSVERWRSLGQRATGSRAQVQWHGLGTSRSRGRIFRFQASAAVVRETRGAMVDAGATAA
jgi:hypothetical protein